MTHEHSHLRWNLNATLNWDGGRDGAPGAIQPHIGGGLTTGGVTRPIAFFAPTLHPSGAERVTVNLIQGIVERARAVDIVLAAAEGSLIGQLPPEVRVVDLRARRMIRSLLPLTRYLRRERPCALVSQMNHSNVIALWASRLAMRGTPVVATVHNTLSQTSRHARSLGERLGPHLLRRFYPWAARVVVVSQGAADDLVSVGGLSRDLIEVVYNPVITPALLEGLRQAPGHPWLVDGGPPVVLGVGRLTRQKDFATLLRAFSQLRQRRSARLVVLGEGTERATLETLASELKLGDAVDLPGWRPDVLACMAHSAVFVLSSAWEGLPTVLIEALAAGTRVVSTDCKSGPREILQDGRLGTLVPVGDPTAMAGAIEAALDCPPGSPPMQALAPFTRDAVVDHYLRIIDQV
jgi:glycosyltransferase involved in cell wall biosynthesis